MSQKEDAAPRDFLATLADMPGVVLELSDKLQQVVDKARETGKGGTVTLTLKVKPYDGNQDVMEIVEAVSHKLPEFDRKKKIMYVDHEGQLSRTDPNVLDFGNLATVERSTGEIKEVKR